VLEIVEIVFFYRILAYKVCAIIKVCATGAEKSAIVGFLPFATHVFIHIFIHVFDHVFDHFLTIFSIPFFKLLPHNPAYIHPIRINIIKFPYILSKLEPRLAKIRADPFHPKGRMIFVSMTILRHQYYYPAFASVDPISLIQPRLYFLLVPTCRPLLDNLSNECNNSLFHVESDDPLSGRLRIHVQRRRLVALSRVVALVQSIAVLWKC
jgi:hypothetical protein